MDIKERVDHFEKIIKYIKQGVWMEKHPDKVDKSMIAAHNKLKEFLLENKKKTNYIIKEIKIIKGWEL